MLAHANDASEALVRFSRRSLWTAFILVTSLGASAVALTLFADSAAAAMAGRLMRLFPVMIAMALIALRSTATRSGPAIKAVLNDELRQLSLALAYRNGLIAVLAVQAAMALLLAYVAASYPVAVMASVSVTTGVAVTLASLLFYDR
ncbi:hypothetical protein AAKU55_002933 [Oxalobacteraceae bacterium GrIS 1.11]